ncbi:BTAD domain-containing putative transcriptional regulator [Streptomyces sp. B1866]|uniref:AfsR/SARP family transcriptional regulator n=1 Tax=Streptomyces sp. B1866 TaxID=3075431 RepID=UPI002891BB39|nr:BTAD domain-containing putative transcriptional regulator [Streptomyces sp. B1866]MDT3395917.1 BTAD domain-containing putative transcriptional regulator [Streptomyces sp. B1866]
MEFRVLGPLELWAGGSQHPLDSPKVRCLLAVLLCAEGTPVPVDTLMRRVWDGQDQPSSATLHSNISRLRSQLRAAVGDGAHVAFAARSYVLRVDPGAVDLRRFQQLRSQARAAADGDDPHRAAALLRQAEALWRAEPLAEFPGSWAAATRKRLTEDLRRVRDGRIRLELDLGRHADLVGELYELVAHEPDPDPYARHLMVALHRCGRQGDALAVYRETRRRLSAELGTDPSPELEDLHQRILNRDATLAAPARDRSRPRPAPQGNLPRDVHDFTGRRAELARLLREPEPGDTALPLTVVHGLGGVGKTTLATRAAHLLADRYPDGRFFVELHAHAEQPLKDPADALAILLRMVGVRADELQEIKALDARAALWRERTAHRSVLLVLDDARSAAQIRPLLPGTPTCCVFVTSRYRLADLEGARSVFLDVPDTAEAADMFTRVAGRGRVADSGTVRKVVNLCNRFPLAIRLAAHRFRHRDAWEVHDLADQLARSPHPLEEIDTAPGIATAFDLSYAGLRESDRLLLRRLALHPGGDFTLQAACVLADADPAEVRRGLDELLDVHLLEEPVKERYRLHDVVRGYAVRVGERDDSEADRAAAVRRVLDHYLVVADRADRLVHPLRRRREVPVAHPRGYAPQFADADEAMAWFDLNRGNLLAAARLAADRSPEHAALFPHVLDQAFHIWGMWGIAVDLNAAALAALRSGGDRAAVALALVERAALLWPRGAPDDAMRCGREALAAAREAGDRWVAAEALEQMGIADLVSGRLAEALARFREALPLHRTAGNRSGEAEALNHQGIALAQLGRLEEAARQFRDMLALHRATGNVRGQIKALNNIGELYGMRERFEKAREYYERSLELVRQVGGRQELAILYNNLGNTCRDGGRSARALDYFRLALETYQAIGDRHGEADSLINLGLAYQALGRHAEARTHLALADTLAQRTGDAYQRQQVLAATAASQRACGQQEEALATYREARSAAHRLHRPLEEARALEAIADLVRSRQGGEAAEALWRDALALYEELGLADEARAVRLRMTGGTARANGSGSGSGESDGPYGSDGSDGGDGSDGSDGSDGGGRKPGPGGGAP